MGIVQILQSGASYLRLETPGTTAKFGIGIEPTAKLHLAAGTAAAGTAPLKLVTGTALAAIEDGAMEYYSSHLYFSIGAARYQLDQQLSSGMTSPVVVASASLVAPVQSGAIETNGTYFYLTYGGVRYRITASVTADCLNPSGYFGGGTTSGVVNTVSKYRFGDDNISAGTGLSGARQGAAACSSLTVGYFGGGFNTSVYGNVSKYRFSDDNLSAGTVLAVATYFQAACSSPS